MALALTWLAIIAGVLLLAYVGFMIVVVRFIWRTHRSIERARLDVQADGRRIGKEADRRFLASGQWNRAGHVHRGERIF